MRHRLGAALWLILLVAATLWLRREMVWSAEPRVDESIFLGAFDAVDRGESPYSAPVFNYPPPFAVVGARLCRVLGRQPFLVLLRHAEVLGACVIGFLAVRRTRWPLWLRSAASLAIAAFSSPIGAALGQGNVAPLIQALALIALALVPSAPIVAGLLLGATIALKPLVAALVPLLFLYRPPEPSAAPRIAALSAAFTTAALLLGCGAEYLTDMLARGSIIFPSDHNLSLSRIFGYVGIELPAGLVFAVVVGAAGWFVARRRPPREVFEVAATSASVLSLPMIWPHTLAIAFGTQCLALSPPAGRRTRRDRLALWLALAAVVSIEGSAGGGAAPIEWPGYAKSLLAAIPLLALGLVTWAALRNLRAAPNRARPAAEPFR